MSRRHLLMFVGVGFVLLSVWLLSRWQPERQVQRHTEQFLTALEDRDFKEMSELIADDYTDRWEHTKVEALERARPVFAQFFVLTVAGSDYVVDEAEGVGTARVRIELSGRGGPIADYAIDRVRQLKQPFAFTWKQQSWKPWDWKLIRIEQPELRIDEY